MKPWLAEADISIKQEPFSLIIAFDQSQASIHTVALIEYTHGSVKPREERKLHNIKGIYCTTLHVTLYVLHIYTHTQNIYRNTEDTSNVERFPEWVCGGRMEE